MTQNSEFINTIQQLEFIYLKQTEKKPSSPLAAITKGALTGGAVGSMIPGIGTLIGAIGGGIMAMPSATHCLRPFHMLARDERNEFRENYNIPSEEQILFFADSLYSIYITDQRIMWENEENNLNFLDWETIQEVSYKENNLWIETIHGEIHNIPTDWFWDGEEPSAQDNREIADILTNAAKCKQTPLVKELCQAQSFEEIKNILQDGEHPQELELIENIEWLTSIIENIGEETTNSSELLRMKLLAKTLERNQQVSKAKYCLQQLKSARKNPLWEKVDFAKDLINTYIGTLGYIFDTSNDFRNILWTCIQDADSNELWLDFSQRYNENFTKLPYNERKLIMPVTELPEELPSSFTALDINNMPEIVFPLGHPQVNELYIAHPLKAGYYFPIESYQLDLLDEQARELGELLQALGATEMQAKVLNAQVQDTSSTKNLKGKLQGNYQGNNSSIQGHAEYSSQNMTELEHRFNIEQKYAPTNAPYIPDELTWYKHFASWQQLVKQRLRGGLLQHKETLSTKNNQLMNEKDKKSVCLEVNALIFGTEITGDYSTEQEINKNEQVTLAFECKFMPIEQLPSQQNAHDK